ncbi:DUF6726 family protein [Sulfurovum mangrovi]|uniref:DUF6726 family protein n=1 Tax=Sulfurovum mangrovi TaxID=2893889 RepID=UPI001E6497AC|nr:DUF6726 family protein [Sulfurovum mangrovi]UFH58758.1 hypothetical protein LN246_10450 [Sulfurovum mangrovi]
MISIILLFISGCTQVVTAPIYVAGAAVSTTIDVAGATADAVTDDDEEEED